MRTLTGLFYWSKMAKLKEEDKKEIIQEIDDFYDKVKKEREPRERTWYFNLAFFLGHQWIAWNEYTRKIEEPKAPSWRVRITANHIAPICNQIIAKLTKNRPIQVVIPATSEDEDVNTARMGDKILKYLGRILKCQTKNQEMWLWSVITGTAFKVPYWDANAKEVIDESNRTHLGEVGLDILSCFEVYPDIGATSEDINKVLVARTRSLDYIREKYPDTGEEVTDEGISGKTPVEERLFDMMNKSAPDYQPPSKKNVSNKDEDKKGNAIVKEYREKPSSKHSKGRYIIIANGVLLNPDNMDLPYKHLIKEKKLGIIKYDYEKVPGSFWGKGRPEDLIPLQKEYNKTRSQIIEIKNLMAKPKWAVPIGSGIKKTHLTSEPGEIVYYNPGVNKPEQMVPASLPAYVIREPENTKRDMQDVSGIHEVSKAQVPSGVRSGLAIQYLQEQDDTRLGPVIARFEEAEAELGHQLLCLVHENYKELRLIRVIGKNNRIEAFDFKGSQLGDNLDVIVQAGSAFPLNKVAKQQFVLGLWREKIIPDPRQILKMLEFGTFEEIYEDFALDEKNAQEENKLTTDGQNVQAMPYDNDDIHIYEHMRDVKANKYSPIILEFKMRHIDQHSQRKAQMLQAMPTPQQMAGKPSLSPKQQTQLTPKKETPLIQGG